MNPRILRPWGRYRRAIASQQPFENILALTSWRSPVTLGVSGQRGIFLKQIAVSAADAQGGRAGDGIRLYPIVARIDAKWNAFSCAEVDCVEAQRPRYGQGADRQDDHMHGCPSVCRVGLRVPDFDERFGISRVGKPTPYFAGSSLPAYRPRTLRLDWCLQVPHNQVQSLLCGLPRGSRSVTQWVLALSARSDHLNSGYWVGLPEPKTDLGIHRAGRMSPSQTAVRLAGGLHDMALLQLVAGETAGFRHRQPVLLDFRQEFVLARCSGRRAHPCRGRPCAPGRRGLRRFSSSLT